MCVIAWGELFVSRYIGVQVGFYKIQGSQSRQAMVLAHEQDELYGGIFNATYAIVFLGTPHGGRSETTDVAKLVGHVINACLHVSRSGGVAGIARIDVRDTLSNDSDALKILVTSFRNRLHDT